jgi:hypothetical protein
MSIDLSNDSVEEQLDSAKVISAKLPQTASEFHLFESRTHVGQVDFKKSTISTRKRSSLVDEPRVQLPKDATNKQYTLPFRMGALSSLHLPVGLSVISGPTALGKSSLIRALPDVNRILAVEPADSVDELKQLHSFGSVDAALLNAVLIGRESGRLQCIDSLRAPLFEISGPAGKNGVIMPFFTMITRVSMSLAAHQITMLATVNPMDEDPQYVKAFLSKLSSAVPCFIELQSYSKTGNKEVFSGRVTTRNRRQGASFIFDTTAGDGVSATDVEFIVPKASYNYDAISTVQSTQLKETI